MLLGSGFLHADNPGNFDKVAALNDQQWAYKMILMENELDLLKQLKGAGERGRTIQEFATRVALQRLARGGYVIARPAGRDLLNYQRGKDAITEHNLN